MRTQQAVHESAIRAVPAPPAGAGVSPPPRAGRANDNAPRSDAFAATTAEAAGAAAARPVPPVQPTEGPRHGRRVTDRPGSVLSSPEASGPAAGFLAQLISQNGLKDLATDADAAASRPAATDPHGAQRRHYQRVDAYRRTQGLTAPSDVAAPSAAINAEVPPTGGARVVKIEV